MKFTTTTTLILDTLDERAFQRVSLELERIQKQLFSDSEEVMNAMTGEVLQQKDLQTALGVIAIICNTGVTSWVK